MENISYCYLPLQRQTYSRFVKDYIDNYNPWIEFVYYKNIGLIYLN